MQRPLRRPAVLGAFASLAATAIVLAGCSAADSETPAESEEVVLTVGGMPAATDEAALELFNEKVAEFEELNPGITIEGSETVYDPTTFAAQLAGGTLPVVMGVPVTEIQSLIAREQVKELGAYFEADPVLTTLNESVTANVVGPDGGYYGIPVSAFTLAVLVNRAVFEQAGLDPDVTLETWDEVAEAAATITEKTDAAGLAQLTTTNQGGWTLTALSAAFGGLVQETDGGVATSTIDNDATADALEFLSDLRWDDDALGSNFLLDFDAAGPAFAAGQYGMMVGASEWYNPMVRNFGMAPEDYGLFPLPQAAGGLGSLGGGSVSIVRADATEAETDAAVDWTNFFYLNRFADADFAAEEAAATAEAGGTVPRVGLPLVAPEQYDAYLEAIADSINVPLENLETYYSATRSPDFEVVTEPAVEAQQVYGLLDTVLQAVLTDENADIDALLAQAQQQASTIVDDAQAE
ncbi:ABC-type glycerol-3-phosphate transport system substrate-binding protein [Microbacterium terrae]|uniref:Bacterial extracellular solute-binding protein n=1 Tax=Microbacterium terrae TaxID=69369 RepID=A0A0M2H4L6_9MICO|nr:extracellular solute-binding protein [Microbacterium terrae]KJL38682.1 Bacterial extracellular solute-binding protein [Microbacterium terrae]MBP1076101.1 ABC-type glycerol-3-phosphate transport system substrate-binding protein [Microbacterium terrae]GLJ96921.1 sugar ABC transporter substrate-binding protein [Microbacterium terrae]